jgi:hypothetical protein
MDFLPHAVTESAIDELVPLNPGFAVECGAHDHGLEMLPVAHDFDMFAGKSRADALLHAIRCNHLISKIIRNAALRSRDHVRVYTGCRPTLAQFT